MTIKSVNTIVKEVFSKDEIDQIYLAVKKSHGNNFVRVHCMHESYIELPNSIIHKVENIARDLSENKNLILTEYVHARYNNTTSDCGNFHFKPALFPHYDETFKEERFTLDYQLKANTEWKIVVEDKAMVLSDNDACTFSGTNQIHWRTPKDFEDDQYVEMLFFHFTDPTMGKKSDDFNTVMDVKAKRYQKIFFENGGFKNE
jgi:hypothetical protein